MMLISDRQPEGRSLRDVAAGGAPADEAFLDLLERERRAYGLPAALPELAARFAEGMVGLLFAHFAPGPSADRNDVRREYRGLRRQLHEALQLPGAAAPAEAVEEFFAALPGVREVLLSDAAAIHAGDPAAHSIDEVILAYPGFRAIAVQRLAHVLWDLGVPIFPRLLTEWAHRQTGIDIHPGARIGPSFAIDHGTGIVVGETAVLGERVRLYQGVTLGALSVSKHLQSTKRHPTVGDDVIVYANATILGGETVIGRGCVIGGNVWLTRSIPPYSVVMPQAHVDRRAPSAVEPETPIEFNI